MSDAAIVSLFEHLESEDSLAGALVLEEDARKEIVMLAGGDGRAASSLELASQMVDVPESADKASSRLPSRTFRQILVADFHTIK